MFARPHLSVVYSAGGHAGPPLHKPHQHDKIQPLDAVTLVFVGALGLSVRCIKVERVTCCRDARSERPLFQKLQLVRGRTPSR